MQRNIVEYIGIPWNAIEERGTSWNSMGYTVEYHGYTMEYQGLRWIMKIMRAFGDWGGAVLLEAKWPAASLPHRGIP